MNLSEKLARQLRECNKYLSNKVREECGARCGKGENLQSVHDGRRMPMLLCPLRVIVNRMIVGRNCLECRSMRVRQSATWCPEHISHPKLCESFCWHHQKLAGIECGILHRPRLRARCRGTGIWLFSYYWHLQLLMSYSFCVEETPSRRVSSQVRHCFFHRIICCASYFFVTEWISAMYPPGNLTTAASRSSVLYGGTSTSAPAALALVSVSARFVTSYPVTSRP